MCVEFERIVDLHRVGVRCIGIAHWFQNDFIADAKFVNHREPNRLTDESLLTQKGVALLKRMIEKKMVVDVSHLCRAAFDQVVRINASRTPLFASHSKARALCDVPRNRNDGQLRAIAKSAGLIGVCLDQPLMEGVFPALFCLVRCWKYTWRKSFGFVNSPFLQRLW